MSLKRMTKQTKLVKHKHSYLSSPHPRTHWITPRAFAVGVAGADAKPIQAAGFQSANHAFALHTIVYGAPFGVGFILAADFDLKSTAAHGTFPAQGDVGGKGGGNGAHIGHFGGQAHAAAAQVFHIYPGGLELGFFPAHQADLMPLRPSHLLASLAEQLIPPAGFGLQLRFEQIHPLQTVAGIRHEGRHLIDPKLGLLRYGGAFQVGDDPLADEELLLRRFVAKTKFRLPHIRLIVVTRPKHIPTIRAKETNLLDTTTQNARGMTKAGQIGATIQAICGAKSILAPQTGGIVGTI